MEFMSNITSAMEDYGKPSIFEVLSESQLRDLLEPSLRYLLAVATHRHPRYLIRLLNRYDEVYACLMFLVERHYLYQWQGSFTENFYGLKRERVLARTDLQRVERVVPELVRERTKLGRKEVWASLVTIVGIPYLKRKLDDAYEVHAGGAAENLLGANWRRNEPDEDAPTREKLVYQLKQLLRTIYPTINAAYYFSLLAFNLSFLFGRSNYHTPFHWLIGVRMRRLTEADHRAFAAASTAASASNKARSRSPNKPLTFASLLSPTILTRIILPKILDSLKILLPTSIFFLKFLEWWHASDFARQLSAKTAASIELPPPELPVPPSKQDDGHGEEEDEDYEESKRWLVPMPEDSGMCPICQRDLTNPTAAQTGYVFCYPCVFKWVGEGVKVEASGEDEDGVEERRGRCPITGSRLLGGTEGLRRLMV